MREAWDKWLLEEWPKHREESILASHKVEQIHSVVSTIQNDVKHLQKLDVLSTIADTLKNLQDNLIAVLTGKNVIDMETAKEIIKSQQSTYVNIIKTILWVFGSVIGVLIGVKFLIPEIFG